jgi:hypothetical protein
MSARNSSFHGTQALCTVTKKEGKHHAADATEHFIATGQNGRKGEILI